MELPEVKTRVFDAPSWYWDVRDEENMEEHEEELPEVVKETSSKKTGVTITDYFIRRTDTNEPWVYVYSRKKTSSNKKYPCIGGPFDEQTNIIGTEGYVWYNCADNPRWGSKSYPSVVLIWSEMLPND